MVYTGSTDFSSSYRVECSHRRTGWRNHIINEEEESILGT